MKILILSDGIQPESKGGAETVAWNSARELALMGHDVSLITTTRQKEAEEYSEREGVKIHTLFSDYHERWRAYLSLYNPKLVGQVARIMREVGPKVVHVHNIHYHLSYHSLKLAKRSGAKVFLTAHDVMLFHYGKLVEFIDPTNLVCSSKLNYKVSPWQQIKRFKKRYNPFRNIIIRHYLKYVDRVLAVSQALKEALNQNGIQNVQVVHNGINVNEWGVDKSSIETFRKKFNLEGKKVILFGGRMGRLKGSAQATSALEVVVQKVTDAVLLAMGEIKDDEKKSDHIIYTGWLSGEELKTAYYASELVVMPSICFDTFGMVCLEAMACKKPILATCFGGPREVVVENETGFIINPFDVKLFSEKIIELLTDQLKSDKFGEAGYERAKNKFDLRGKTEELIRMYEKAH